MHWLSEPTTLYHATSCMKPQRTPNLKSKIPQIAEPICPYKCTLNHTSTAYKYTHVKTFIIHRITCKKNCTNCINLKMHLYNVFELGMQQSIGSPLFSSLTLNSTQNMTKKIFYMRGLFKLFPPSHLLYSITLKLQLMVV
jgi:hypothetical protein